jgi:manganese efflux pump family protein
LTTRARGLRSSVSFVSLLVLAFAVSLDAVAVAIAQSCRGRGVPLRASLLLAACFGGAQALMPAIGAYAGSHVARYVQTVDHWIAFVVLGFLGGKMMREGFFGAADTDLDTDEAGAARPSDAPSFSAWTLLTLSVATSIDALAIGATLPLLGIHIPLAVAFIGLVTFALSFVGSRVGRQLGERFGTRLGGFGGLLLIGIGTKILVEHLRAGI